MSDTTRTLQVIDYESGEGFINLQQRVVPWCKTHDAPFYRGGAAPHQADGECVLEMERQVWRDE